MRILIVDDDRETCAAFADLLRMQGHDARSVSEAGEALAVAAGMRPDVALIDLQMPMLNGYELAHRFRRDPALRKTALIAVSGFSRPFDRRRALAQGFDDHIPKPVDLGRLERTLAEIAARDPAGDANAQVPAAGQ